MTLSNQDHPPLSRLMLGTVQFGMPYGVANRTGQPSYDEARRIVRAAWDGGVNCFDTAANYGSSEEVLGCVLAELEIGDRAFVVTKVPALDEPTLAEHGGGAATAIRTIIERSRRRLRTDRLPLVLFHREDDAVHLGVLHDLHAEGLIGGYGVSCDNRPERAAALASEGDVSALQVPLNLLDRRHLHGGCLPTAGEKGIAVFLRSVFLQGILQMPSRLIPPPLDGIKAVHQRLTELAAEAGIELGELALRYGLSVAGATSVLVGVETAAQMRDNLRVFQRGPLDEPLLAAIEAAVPELPEQLITPHLWPARPPS